MPDVHVVSTTADSAAIVGDQVVVRDTVPGTYTATLSDGSTHSATITAVPASQDLTDATWNLSAEDWKPANPVGTTGAAGTALTKDVVSLTLDGLKAWPDIPELANASGVGTYTTTVTLPASYDPSSSVTLSLGQVVDTVQVTVNDVVVPIDQLAVTADIGRQLVPGANTLKIRVATTLNNRLANLLPAVATRGVIQEYGLVGPVTLTPSGQAEVLDLDPDAPANTTAPAVSGVAQVGSTLTCGPGTWAGASSYAYAWSANGAVLDGESGTTLAVGPALVGTTVVCTVTATGPGGSASQPSAGVSIAKGQAMVATVKPRITGAAGSGGC